MRAPKCETCPAPIVRKPGSRGPLPKRCDACRAPKSSPAKTSSSAKPRPKPPPALPARGFTGIALEAELAKMPASVQSSTEAACARALAVQVDQGLSMTAGTRELTRVMALLRKMAGEQPVASPTPAPGETGEVPKGVTNLASRVAQRRRQATG